MEPMSRVRRITFWHLVGLAIAFGLATSHLAVWDMNCTAWVYCVAAGIVMGAMALFVSLMGR